MPYRPTGRPRGRPRYADPLTTTQQRMLEALRRGLTNAQIAEELGLSVETVEVNMHSEDRMIVRGWPGLSSSEITRVHNGTHFVIGHNSLRSPGGPRLARVALRRARGERNSVQGDRHSAS